MFMKNIFYDHIDYSLLFCWCRCWILQHFQNQSLICQFSAETLFQLQSWTLLFCELWRLNLHLLATLCKHTSFTACFIYRITIPFFPREFFHFPEESSSRIHLSEDDRFLWTSQLFLKLYIDPSIFLWMSCTGTSILCMMSPRSKNIKKSTMIPYCPLVKST